MNPKILNKVSSVNMSPYLPAASIYVSMFVPLPSNRCENSSADEFQWSHSKAFEDGGEATWTYACSDNCFLLLFATSSPSRLSAVLWKGAASCANRTDSSPHPLPRVTNASEHKLQLRHECHWGGESHPASRQHVRTRCRSVGARNSESNKHGSKYFYWLNVRVTLQVPI